VISKKAVFGLPLPISHGVRPDSSTYIVCGEPPDHGRSFTFSGSPKEALALAQLLNAAPTILAALKAVRSDCRDPDTDAGISPAAGELVDEALQALGVRP